MMIRERETNDMSFISKLFGSAMKIKGTILKVDVDIGVENYTRVVGNPMIEDTLIVGDKDNNIILCFKENDMLHKKHKIIKGVHITPYFDYKRECIVHKKQELADVPDRVVNVIFQTNIVQSITNNFNHLQINSPQPRISLFHEDTFDNFMSTFYTRGGMLSLKDLKNNPEWKKEYELQLTIKRVHICKSCKNKARKGCCFEYSSQNRSMVTMVIGWS